MDSTRKPTNRPFHAMIPSKSRSHDHSILFAVRFTLSSVFMGLAIKWLTTLRSFSWEIWRVLAYFVASALITMLILGPRNAWWMGSVRPLYLRMPLKLMHGILWAFGAGIVLAFDQDGRSAWLIFGSSLAAVAILSWAAVQWADQHGSAS
jgi:hypothetical protein